MEAVVFQSSRTSKAPITWPRNPSSFVLADVAVEEVEWLWYPYIPKRKITLMTGQEGIGKSWLTCAIVAAITNGRGMPELSLSSKATS